ncbi:hypothetical protein ERJ75_001391500 [Trypanosoma vivax]|uniref:Uncharacterized protein n=1 Tax=Trypanosoma vivax (strain Y486) TaxID=1055687 RepID=F9WRL4_TRYVY|nr:hypothetical protein ERJ75_001391500 [Trypanosoma vivax]CCD20198.1 hypothetical protein, conserved in T. vivax [Trypanosoma vivax Y486]|eukprot:CCD20198.1 hypothetical protein, conserved in T. vivax [Trypanosoma vivax Y486]
MNMEKFSSAEKYAMEKLKTVETAVVGAADKFNEAVQSFVAACLAVEGSREICESAMRNATNVSSTILDSFAQNENSFCELLGRHATAEMQLANAKQHFELLMIISSDATLHVSEIQFNMSGKVRLVLSVMNNITSLPNASEVSTTGAFARAGNVATVMRGIVEDTAIVAMNNCAGATPSLSDIESQKSRVWETLARMGTELLDHLSESRTSASALLREECAAKTLNIADNLGKDALRRAVGSNAAALLRTKNSLLGLENKIKEIKTTLANIDNKLRHVVSSAKRAVHVDEVLLKTKTALVDEFGAVMRGFCTATHKLRRVRLDSAFIDERALIQQGKFAAEATRIEAMWSNTSEAPEMPQHVEEGFMVERKVLVALDRARRGSKAINGKVAGKLYAAVEMSGGLDAVAYANVQKFMRNSCTNASASHNTHACDAGYVANILQTFKDKASNSSMLVASPILAQPSLLLEKINGQVVMAHQSVQKAAVGVDAAAVAVEEAVKNARNGSAKQHCTPLYKQLLNTLGSAWRHTQTSA